jgi:ribonuclease H2 subunit A
MVRPSDLVRRQIVGVLLISLRPRRPQAISSNMLRHPATNLNQLSKDATVHLIRTVLAAGIKLSKIYVDALGPSVPYQAYLSGLFPTISITVETKADSKWKIVGAASVAAKVTRDAWIEQWQFAELKAGGTEDWDRAFGSGYPSDPNTKAWIQNNLERTFGFPSIARFSWGTVKNILDEPKYKIQW